MNDLVKVKDCKPPLIATVKLLCKSFVFAIFINPKSTTHHLKLGIKALYRNYVSVPADKAANKVVIVSKLYWFNTLKQELRSTKAYEETSEDEKSVVFGHCNDMALKFSVTVKEQQDKLPTTYWLPKLHKRPYKARFIVNASALSKLLISCFTAIKIHVIRYCEKVYQENNLFWSIQILLKYLIN